MLPLLLLLCVLGLKLLLQSQVSLQQQCMAPKPGQNVLLQLDVCLKACTLQLDTCMSEMHCQEAITQRQASPPSCCLMQL